MAEKRRGLGRGLGALIPSAPVEESTEPVAAEPIVEVPVPASANQSETARKPVGRPVDLFFERITEDDVADQPRSYSSALRSGINRNVLEAQTKRVAKPAKRTGSPKAAPISPVTDTGATAGPARESQAAAVDAGGRDDSVLGTPSDDRSAQETPVRREIPGGDGADDIAPSTDVGSEIEARTADLDMGGAESNLVDAAGEATATDNDSHGTNADARSGDERSPRVPEAGGRDLVPVPGATFADLPLDAIHPNRKQPRVEFDEDELSELVHSIREIGVLQPIVVRPSQESGDAEYELVMGERRWRASREAGMESIPAIIRSTLDDDLLRDALLENLHRSALNPLEEAAAYQQLLDDFGCSHDELAGRLGRSRPQISNTLRLMKLPPLVQRRVAAGVLSAGHARALLGLGDPADMEKLAQRIVAEGLSVRSTEEIVALSGGLRRPGKQTGPRDGARHERLDYLATSLSDRLDTNVKITLGAKKGRVSIEFASVDDLNRIVGVLSPPSP